MTTDCLLRGSTVGYPSDSLAFCLFQVFVRVCEGHQDPVLALITGVDLHFFKRGVKSYLLVNCELPF